MTAEMMHQSAASPAAATAGLAAPDELDLEAALAHVAQRALTPTTTRRVGLELELHLVDLTQPARRPAWTEVVELTAGLPAMPSGSSVTFEPGGQIELSTPPHDDVASSVAALQADLTVLRSALAARGLGGAALGTDPARPLQRINPAPRYAAMEEHFAIVGCAEPGRAMMTATAALQVNLDAGPQPGWRQRLELIGSLVPMLVATSATSPYLAGSTSGWHSMRQQIWNGIDHCRSDPIPPGDPGERWAHYALGAPVMLTLDGDGRPGPVPGLVTFREWVADPARLGRAATRADLDYHLTTLFPPVRPRGYVEIRCTDAMPDRWWPALAGLVATLVDDPVAADRAAELCEPVAGAWESAAETGIAEAGLRRAVVGCAEVAAARAPAALRADLESFAELLADGQTPGGLLGRRMRLVGPLAVLEEEARG